MKDREKIEKRRRMQIAGKMLKEISVAINTDNRFPPEWRRITVRKGTIILW